MYFFKKLKSAVGDIVTITTKDRKEFQINRETKIPLHSDGKLFFRIVSGDAVIFHRVYRSEISSYIKILKDIENEKYNAVEEGKADE